MRRRRHTRSRPRPSAIVNSWLAVQRTPKLRTSFPSHTPHLIGSQLLVVTASASRTVPKFRGPHTKKSTWLTPVNGSRGEPMFDYGGDDRSYQRGDLKVCIGHKAMVGVPATDDYVECTLHHINVTCDDRSEEHT